MSQLKFNFAWFALVSIDFDEDGEPDFVRLLSFHWSEREAMLEIANLEAKARQEHDDCIKKNWYKPAYKPGHYEIVPLAQVKCDSLDKLERLIEEAAKRQAKGIGVREESHATE
jgi:hypothetical protein